MRCWQSKLADEGGHHRFETLTTIGRRQWQEGFWFSTQNPRGLGQEGGLGHQEMLEQQLLEEQRQAALQPLLGEMAYINM